MDIIRGKCIDINSDGKGVVIKDRSVFFVDNLFLNEEAEIDVLKFKEGAYFGRVRKLIKKSPNRIEPKCKYCDKCGGCQYQQINYETQLEYKAHRVKRALENYGFEDIKVNKCIGAPNPYNYRNKIQMPFSRDRQGNVIYGFYKEGTHEIFPINECYIEDKKAGPIIKTVKELVTKLNISTYNEKINKGILRYVIIRTSYHTNDLMVVFVTTEKNFYKQDELVKSLLAKHKEITTIVNNINRGGKTSVVLGKEENVLYGPGYIKDSILGLSFNISASSFFQVNPVQVEILYKKALDLIDINKNEVVLDAYSGVGTIGLIAAKNAKEVISVEINKDASKNAVENAKRNNINNIQFFNDDAGKFIESYSGDLDVVIMDPPRTGSDKRFLSILKNRKIRKIIYVSCDPETLARDLEYMKDLYDITYVQPVDMFPQTSHVETIVLLEKKL